MTLSPRDVAASLPWLSPTSRPATWSDLFLLPASAYSTIGDETVGILCPDRPDFVFGNYLIERDPPAIEGLPALAARWTAALGSAPGARRAALQWEGPSEVRGLDDPAWSLDRCVVLELAAGRFLAAPAQPGVTIRPVSLHGELEAVLALISEGFGSSADRGSFDHWRLGEYARLIDDGRGEWLGAWVGSTMVATAGMFECGGILRFQYLVTAPSHRRQGHSAALCRAALARHLGRLRAIAVAEPDGAAERLYHRLGYQRVGWQLAWLADRNDVAVLAGGARRYSPP